MVGKGALANCCWLCRRTGGFFGLGGFARFEGEDVGINGGG